MYQRLPTLFSSVICLFLILLCVVLFFVLITGYISNSFYAFLGFIIFCFSMGSCPIWIAWIRGISI